MFGQLEKLANIGPRTTDPLPDRDFSRIVPQSLWPDCANRTQTSPKALQAAGRNPGRGVRVYQDRDSPSRNRTIASRSLSFPSASIEGSSARPTGANSAPSSNFLMRADLTSKESA